MTIYPTRCACFCLRAMFARLPLARPQTSGVQSAFFRPLVRQDRGGSLLLTVWHMTRFGLGEQGAAIPTPLSLLCRCGPSAEANVRCRCRRRDGSLACATLVELRHEALTLAHNVRKDFFSGRQTSLSPLHLRMHSLLKQRKSCPAYQWEALHSVLSLGARIRFFQQPG